MSVNFGIQSTVTTTYVATFAEHVRTGFEYHVYDPRLQRIALCRLENVRSRDDDCAEAFRRDNCRQHLPQCLDQYHQLLVNLGLKRLRRQHLVDARA